MVSYTTAGPGERAGAVPGGPRACGQSLALVAVMLPFLGALLAMSIELGERALERALVEDAIRQAARSAVQRFDYAGFAADETRLAAEAEPVHVGCGGTPAGSARAVGCAVLMRNLSGLRGLAETPEALAARVSWSIYPSGGSCAITGAPEIASAGAPLVCVSARPRLTGLLGWGVWSPQIEAVETLDTTD